MDRLCWKLDRRSALQLWGFLILMLVVSFWSICSRWDLGPPFCSDSCVSPENGLRKWCWGISPWCIGVWLITFHKVSSNHPLLFNDYIKPLGRVILILWVGCYQYIDTELSSFLSVTFQRYHGGSEAIYPGPNLGCGSTRTCTSYFGGNAPPPKKPIVILLISRTTDWNVRL